MSRPLAGEDISLYDLAVNEGLVPTSMELLDELEVAPIGPPPRPKLTKFPGDLGKALEKLKEREATARNNILMREDNKTVSLSTSKVNYIDPRIVLAWTQREGVPPAKVFSKTLIKKFTWAAGVDPNYTF
jgi:DNA topoisomerase-1